MWKDVVKIENTFLSSFFLLFYVVTISFFAKFISATSLLIVFVVEENKLDKLHSIQYSTVLGFEVLEISKISTEK